MAYCTSTDVKKYLGINSTNNADDALITALIARAQARIEIFTHRTFISTADSTRYFDVSRDVDGQTLYLDEDLAKTPTTVTSNADSTSPTTITSTQYYLQPRNRSPKYAIKLKDSENVDWDYTDDPESGISIVGRWAYSTTPPNDVKDVCIRLSALYYRIKDAPFGNIAVDDAGGVTIGDNGINDLLSELAHYVKVA